MADLYLKFYLGSEAYALPARSIEVIVPAVPFRPLEFAPEYVAGLMDFQGTAVPVLDLCQLCLGRPVCASYSSRVILVRYPLEGRSVRLGLLAEQVLQLIRCPASEFRPLEMSLPQSRVTGEVAHLDGQMIASVQVEQLLSPEVRELLFAATAQP